MQEQEKKTRGRKPANATANAVETKKEEPKKNDAPLFTEEQVRKMIEEAVAKFAVENKQEAATQPINTNDGVVTMIFQAEVNDANEIPLGPNGKFGIITGKHATITIPKRDFIGEFRTTTVQYYLKTRNLIVVDGLTDDERKVYGLDYEKGEYLEPAVYENLLNSGDEILDVFPKLHRTWREMIATKAIDAFEAGTLKTSRDVLIELNKISKRDYANSPKDDIRRKGGFWPIIHAMNAADESDE